MAIYKKEATILAQKQIGGEIYDMTIHFPEAAAEAVPGQFLCLYCSDGARLLPRPISICQIDREGGNLRMVYRIAGAGTREMSEKKQGEKLQAMGPLGNGFTIGREDAILVGGGIGIPPMLELARTIPGRKTVVLGYRDETFLLEEFSSLCDTFAATEDGSCGVKGTVIDAIRAYDVKGKQIYACGPMPMLKALADYARSQGLEAQISLEERMACGIGACLGCITRTKSRNAHTNSHNARICKDGPVFDIREVAFE